MKRWAEFERDRRWKSGTQSRDSTYYEKKTDSNRYSLASNSDLTHQPPTLDASTVESASYSSPRQRHDSNALLMLPAPLAVNRPLMSSASSVGMRSSEDNYASDNGSNLRLIPSHADTYAETSESGSTSQRLLSPTSPYDPRFSRQAPSPQPPSLTENPFRSQTTSPTMYDEQTAFIPDYDDPHGRGGARGVRLTDSGPVPGPDGVRRVSRPQGRRPTSQAPQQNRYSRNSAAFSLPPGAAPPHATYGAGPQ